MNELELTTTKIYHLLKDKLAEPIIFPEGSVPVSVAAKVYGKDATWIRAGIVAGWLPIGKATRKDKLVTKVEDLNSKYGRTNFYISPKKLYEDTGYVWKGADHGNNH